MEIIFLEKARTDVRTAFEWYEKESYGLGKIFVTYVVEGSKKLHNEKMEYRKFIPGIEYVRIKKFPFTIFFFRESAKIVVLAVLHNKQDTMKILLNRIQP